MILKIFKLDVNYELLLYIIGLLRIIFFYNKVVGQKPLIKNFTLQCFAGITCSRSNIHS